MKRLKKVGIFLGGLFGIAGVAFATFLVTQTISTGNTVTAESASLSVVSTPFSISSLALGGSTSPNALTITNTGSASGDVKVNIINPTGTNCKYMSLVITGTASGTAILNAATSIDLGNLAAGAIDTLNQVVNLSDNGSLGGTCSWDETATLSGN